MWKFFKWFLSTVGFILLGIIISSSIGFFSTDWLLIFYLSNFVLINVVVVFTVVVIIILIIYAWQKEKESHLRKLIDVFKPVDKIRHQDFGLAKFHKYYQSRESDDLVLENLFNGHPVLIIGKPGMGKTRTVFESIKSSKSNGFYLIKPSLGSELRFKEIQTIKLPFWVRRVVLFLDDLDKVTVKCDIDHLVNRLKDITINLHVLATCRSGRVCDNLNGKKGVESLLNSLKKLEPRKLTQIEEQKLAQNLNIDLKKIKSDGTPGSIVLGLGAMKERYDNFKEEKFVLKSLKLLREGKIFFWDEKLIMEVAKTVFGLNLQRYKWEECMNSLIDHEFFIENIRPAIKMEHDIYLDDVIVDDYQPSLMDLQKLKGVLVKEKYDNFLLGLGVYLYEIGDFELAEDCCQQAIEINAKYADAYYNWGNALVKLGRHEKAIEKYQKVVEINPKDAEAYYNWGVALGKLGRDEEAIEEFKKAVEVNPKLAEAYYNWGAALGKLGRDEEAIEKYQKAVEVNPKLAEAYNNWGVALKNLGKYEEAIGKYQKALEINPKYDKAYFNWGVALGNLDRNQEAIEKYQKAVGINPKHAEAYGNWAVALWDLGNKEEAKEKFSIAKNLFEEQGRKEDVQKVEAFLKQLESKK